MYTKRYQSRSVAYYAIQFFKVVFLDGSTVGYPQRALKNLLSIGKYIQFQNQNESYNMTQKNNKLEDVHLILKSYFRKTVVDTLVY